MIFLLFKHMPPKQMDVKSDLLKLYDQIRVTPLVKVYDQVNENLLPFARLNRKRIDPKKVNAMMDAYFNKLLLNSADRNKKVNSKKKVNRLQELQAYRSRKK